MKQVILILTLIFTIEIAQAQTVFELKPDTLGISAFYGTKVDLQGSYAVVGTGPGLLIPPIGPYIYLFGEENGQWELKANLVSIDSSGTFFTDAALDIQNDKVYIAAGDMDDDDVNTNTGAVYLFEYDPVNETWIQLVKLKGGGFTESQALLGSSVAMDGDYIVAGSPHKDLTLNLPNPNDGAAIVYMRDAGTGSWVIDEELQASDFRPDAKFGQAVGISGDFIVVGAPFGDTLSDGGVAGSAYIFERKSTGWEEIQRLVPSVQSPIANITDNFGWSVDIEGDFAIVGAYSHVINTDNPTGMAAIFQRINNVWEEVALLIPSDEIASGSFGWDVSIDANGNAAVASFSSIDGNSAYVYKKEGNAWIEQSPKINIEAGGTSAVAIDGDDLLFGSSDITGGFSRIYRGICTGAVSIGPSFEQNPTFKLYPNPVSDQVFVRGIKHQVSVHIFNMKGQLVLEKELSAFQAWMDVETLNTGKYIVILEEGNQRESSVLWKK